MAAMTLKSLTEKLNSATRQGLQKAVALCCQHRHFDVDIEHLLKALLDQSDADIRAVIGHFNISTHTLNLQLQQALDNQRRGHDSTPALAPRLVDLLRQCWLDTSIEFGYSEMRGLTLLYTLLADPASAIIITHTLPELAGIDSQILLQQRELILQQMPAAAAAPATSATALGQFTQDLTQQARDGQLDPVLGRDNEIRQVIDILSRRRQNNPMLTGEAGVGKTAVVEGLALRIAAGTVPDALKNTRVLSLDLALLQAGAGVKGEFENRLKGLIQAVKTSPQPIILFIDEAHTMIGAGGQAGQNDAANLLKPALARGELRTIAATTWAEYKKYFEKDAALSRRFQVISIAEPDTDTAVAILRALQPTLERHHQVRITEQALVAAVVLSQRYLPERQLPDKCVSLLDTACARVAMSQSSPPAHIDTLQHQLHTRRSELNNIEQEQRSGINHQQRRDVLLTDIDVMEQELTDVTARWSAEQAQVTKARHLVEELSQQDCQYRRADIQDLRQHLQQRQQPLVYWQVDEHLIAAVLADWTGIPLGRMQADEITRLLQLDQYLKARVKGQDHAMDTIARTVRIARTQLADEKKPLGVFLLAGPSGVGKTETAAALAEQLFGSEDHLTIINMSEFKEEHKVSQLMGSPAGYVGYGEGGILTNAIRRKPYSVILLDEMEKAHSGVQDIFYQVFDKGSLRDGEGIDVDFKNTVIIITSNAASELITDLYADTMTAPQPENLTEIIWDELLKFFKPAFLGRTTVLPYQPLDRQQLFDITTLQLQRIENRIRQHHRASFTCAHNVADTIAEQCQQSSSGARLIQTLLNQQILPEMAEKILLRVAAGDQVKDITIAAENGKFSISVC